MTAAILLFIVNLIFKGFLIGKTPNSLSLSEIDLLRRFNVYPAIGDYSFRYLAVIMSAAISLLTFYFIYRQTKNFWLAIAVVLSLTFAPYLFILSRFLNVYIAFLFLIAAGLALLPNNKLKYLAIIILVFAFSDRRIVSADLNDLFKILDLRNLFFAGDTVSSVLHIPLTGFFMYVDLFFLFAGWYFLYLKKGAEKLVNPLNFLFATGIVFYFLSTSSSLNTYRGLLIFYYLSIVIGSGYYFLARNRLLPLIIIIVLANIVFYQELAYNHFDKKSSFEWGYAEQATIQYFNNRHLSQPLILSKSSAGKLDRYVNFFSNTNFKTKTLTVNQMKKTCVKNSSNYCLVREDELPYFGLAKDDIKLVFRYYDGLPMYFLLPTR